MDLVIKLSVPLTVALGGWFLGTMNSNRQNEIAQANQKDTVIRDYIKEMKGMLLDKTVAAEAKTPGSEANGVARALTLAALAQVRGEGPERRSLVFQFLRETNLPILAGSGNQNGANLARYDLRGAFLPFANLNRAYLLKADLSGANLNRVNLSNADLGHANLSEAELNGANLRRASLYKTNLRGADLGSASLHEADLTEAILSGANLVGTNLRGADLRGAHLGSPEKGIRRLDPNTANERRVVGPNAWLYSGQ